MQPFYEDKQDEFRCTLTRDITFPAHLHSAVELIYLLEGSLEVTVQNRTKRIRKDEAALIFPDMVHSYLTTDACLGILCIFSPAYARDYYHLFRKQQPESPFLSSGTRNPDIPLAFGRMLRYRELSLSVSAAWLNLILSFLLSDTVLLPRDSTDSADVGYRLISYVSQHFQEPLTLDSLARELHFNKYYISRVFTARLRCGFYEYVNRLRLDYLPPDCDPMAGDIVVTSGLNGYYPSGLVIGSVEEVRLDDSGAASYAILVPAVDFDALTEVFVIKSFEIVT